MSLTTSLYSRTAQHFSHAVRAFLGWPLSHKSLVIKEINGPSDLTYFKAGTDRNVPQFKNRATKSRHTWGYDESENAIHFYGITDSDGFAMWRTMQAFSLLGPMRYNLLGLPYLHIKLKSMEDRQYFFNIQARAKERKYIYQHPVFFSNPEHWETVVLDMRDFTQTLEGTPTKLQPTFPLEEVYTFGMSILDRQSQTFDLYIKSIIASSSPHTADPNQISNSFENDDNSRGKPSFAKKIHYTLNDQNWTEKKNRIDDE